MYTGERPNTKLLSEKFPGQIELEEVFNNGVFHTFELTLTRQTQAQFLKTYF